MKIIERISFITGLSSDKSKKVLEEVFSALDLTLEEYITKRHNELSKDLKNDQIYVIIQNEIKNLRFKSKPLSLRQIRRIIYG
ncbi:MAG: hypothetical protein JXA60_04475 [Candidatus Coatesbacteria bacterium]|nr:hypothetical protein [Candidatus Coatesbacteria bacterium]